MSQIKFSEFSIIAILNEATAGTAIDDICKKYQICLGTFTKWEKHYKSIKAPSPMKRNKRLEEINMHFKNLFNQVCNTKKRLQSAMK